MPGWVIRLVKMADDDCKTRCSGSARRLALPQDFARVGHDWDVALMHRVAGQAVLGTFGAWALFAGQLAPLLAAPARSAIPIQSGKTTQAAKPVQAPRAIQDDAYILGAGDGLELKLFDAPELSGSIDVLNDGTASLTLIGNVRVQGLTISPIAMVEVILLGTATQSPTFIANANAPIWPDQLPTLRVDSPGKACCSKPLIPS